MTYETITLPLARWKVLKSRVKRKLRVPKIRLRGISNIFPNLLNLIRLDVCVRTAKEKVGSTIE